MDRDKPGAKKSPRRTKAESYSFDRRDRNGAHDKGSRKSIPARKGNENRRSRRKAAQALGRKERLAESDLEVAESSLRHDVERVGGWKKSPDTPLREVLTRRSKRRN